MSSRSVAKLNFDNIICSMFAGLLPVMAEDSLADHGITSTAGIGRSKASIRNMFMSVCVVLGCVENKIGHYCISHQSMIFGNKVV